MKKIFAALSYFLVVGCTSPSAPKINLVPSVWNGQTTYGAKTDSVEFVIEQADPVSGKFFGVITDGTRMALSGYVRGQVSGSKMQYTMEHTNGLQSKEEVRGKLYGNTFSGTFKKAEGTVSFVLRSTDPKDIATAKQAWNIEAEREKIGMAQYMASQQKEMSARQYRGGYAPSSSGAGLSGVIAGDVESRIDGDFEGWEGETIVKLENGQIWQQTEYHYHYHYAYRPKTIILKTTTGYKMIVEGTSKAIRVTQLR